MCELARSDSSYESSAPDPARNLAALQRAERRLGGEPPRLDRVVDALQPRHVDEPRALADEQQPGRVESRGQRVVPALGDRLRAPRDALAAAEDLPDEPVRLELLQHVVHGELDVRRLEPGDEADRHEVVAHRVDEGAAELAEARRRPQRPAHRVDDLSQRLADAPDLLHAERPDLRVLAVEPELVDGRAGQVPLRALREHGEAGDDVVPRLERRKRLPRAAASPIARAHADDAAVLDEELRRRRLGKNDRAERLGLLGEEAPELGHRDDEVPVVAHRRRRRDPERRAARQDVHRFAGHLAVRREVGRLEPPAEELAQRRRVQHRAGQQVRARLLALLEHRDGNVAEPLADVRMLLEQLAEPNRAREPARPRADDRDADLDPLVGRIRRRADRVAGAERRSEVDRPGHGA